MILEELDDDEHDDDTCHHGIGFDEYCEDCEDEDAENEAMADEAVR